MDRAFAEVIAHCANVLRKDEDGTWITQEMIDAYIRLHKAGYAHSVEAWDCDGLAGGLYGVILGRAFFSENRCLQREAMASKTAFVTLTERLAADGFELIDCQVTTGAFIALRGARSPAFLILGDAKKSDWVAENKGVS